MRTEVSLATRIMRLSPSIAMAASPAHATGMSSATGGA